ncbi:MAG: hypothetical protein OEV73_00450 [Desulfobulbaceae bacterium]|nr:hypothetical protein [Desulfobulbaceae bacterium]
MPRIKLAEELRYAHCGHTVRAYGSGEYEVAPGLDRPGCIPPDAADYALGHGLAETVKAAPDPGPTGQTLADLIAMAITCLVPGTTDFTGNGKPQVQAISEILGEDITATQRDAVWQEINE